MNLDEFGQLSATMPLSASILANTPGFVFSFPGAEEDSRKASQLKTEATELGQQGVSRRHCHPC